MGLIVLKHIWRGGGGGVGGSIETGGLINLARTMASVLYKELEYNQKQSRTDSRWINSTWNVTVAID